MADLKAQLMKAGLANAKKARQVEHAKRQEARDPNAETAQKLAAKAMAEKLERDREMNKRLEEERAQKALGAQISQLIQAHRIDRQNGEMAYQFTDDKKIKKLYVTDLQHSQLSRGLLAIVRLGDGYEVVPAVVAEKVKSRDDSYVLVLNTKSANEVDEDDPYADYQIPDDLMW